jgi:hypothetical protein
MLKRRNYWVYSIGCFLAWAVRIALPAARGRRSTTPSSRSPAGPSAGDLSIHHLSDGSSGPSSPCSRSQWPSGGKEIKRCRQR